MGWTAAQAVGKRAQELLRTVFPRPVEEIRAELLRTGRWDGELTKTRADGTQVVVASRWSLQRDADGRPLAILDTNNDITERKRSEDEIRKLNAQLERRASSSKRATRSSRRSPTRCRTTCARRCAMSRLMRSCSRTTRPRQLDERSRRYVTTILEAAKQMGDADRRPAGVLAHRSGGDAHDAGEPRRAVREVLRELERRDERARHRVEGRAPLPSVHGDRAMLQARALQPALATR